jgi:predicted CoA-substrate-specific enzyme activase
VRVAGIDIGSRTVKVVLLKEGDLLDRRVLPNSHDPVETCRSALEGLAYDRIVGTGYGRHLFRQYWDCEVVTEIRAVAVGTRFLGAGARTILDVGGQDTKAIALAPDGGVRKFEMNDRCAAGTGRFLEVMASALSYAMPDFIEASIRAPRSQKLSSMCTVFAESEVVSSVARGVPREELALGVHEAIAARSVGLLRRVPIEDDVVFCGGVALNACIRGLIERESARRIVVPDEPQIVAALGCALLGAAASP